MGIFSGLSRRKFMQYAAAGATGAAGSQMFGGRARAGLQHHHAARRQEIRGCAAHLFPGLRTGCMRRSGCRPHSRRMPASASRAASSMKAATPWPRCCRNCCRRIRASTGCNIPACSTARSPRPGSSSRWTIISRSIERRRTIWTGSCRPTAEFYTKWNGKTYGVMLDGDIHVLHYRKSHFANPDLQKKYLRPLPARAAGAEDLAGVPAIARSSSPRSCRARASTAPRWWSIRRTSAGASGWISPPAMA